MGNFRLLASDLPMQQTVSLAFLRQPVITELVIIMFYEVLVSCSLKNMQSSKFNFKVKVLVDFS